MSTHHTIKITTLTPVHIGSGQVMYRDLGFRPKGNALTFQPEILQRPDLPLAPGIKSDAERELRLHLQDGQGHLLLPGSSLKGALKTLWIAQALAEASETCEGDHPALAELYRNMDKWSDQMHHGSGKPRGHLKSSSLETNILGGSFDTDPFQRLQVGDASFKEMRAEHIGIRNYNGTRGREIWKDKEQHWLLETIPAGASSQARLNWAWFDCWSKTYITETQNGPITTSPRVPAPRLSILLDKLRTASRYILDQELEFWNTWTNQGMEDYIEFLEQIQQQIGQLPPNACIIRLGYGSGFNTITGCIPWGYLTNPDDWQVFFHFIRPQDTYYGPKIPAPKTRKVTQSLKPLGFIRLDFPTLP